MVAEQQEAPDATAAAELEGSPVEDDIDVVETDEIMAADISPADFQESGGIPPGADGHALPEAGPSAASAPAAGGAALPPQQQGSRTGTAGEGLGAVMQIPVSVDVVLGSKQMTVSEITALGKGSIIALDRAIGEPVDLVVNGRAIARGKIVVLDDDPSRFGLTLETIISS